MAKRNKTTKTTAPKEAKVTKKKVVNADEMAKAVASTTGNDYQQYIRNLFKDKLDRR